MCETDCSKMCETDSSKMCETDSSKICEKNCSKGSVTQTVLTYIRQTAL